MTKLLVNSDMFSSVSNNENIIIISKHINIISLKQNTYVFFRQVDDIKQIYVGSNIRKAYYRSQGIRITRDITAKFTYFNCLLSNKKYIFLPTIYDTAFIVVPEKDITIG